MGKGPKKNTKLHQFILKLENHNLSPKYKQHKYNEAKTPTYLSKSTKIYAILIKILEIPHAEAETNKKCIKHRGLETLY